MKEEFKVTLPKLGESIVSATIVQWFKNIGDEIQLDEPLLEVSTDKVNSEIPSPVSGVLKEILASPDEELQVGDALAVIVKGLEKRIVSEPVPTFERKEVASEATSSEMKGFFSPAILRLAKEQGIRLEEIDRIPSTGEGGRLTKKDLETYIQQKMKGPKPCPAIPQKAIVSPMTPTVSEEEIERVKMSGMRKAIAENMVRSFYEAPHATLVHQVDITEVQKLIQKEKEAFLAKHGVKLTITSFIARAISKALQEYPLINSSLDQDTIMVKRYVNLGIAVSIDQGLMVPVIKNCQRKTLSEIAKAINELSTKARSGKLSPDDVKGGTISMTNFGMTGVLIGVPIIRYPEVAIIGIGATHKQVVPLENDILAVRTMVNISLTFDHRVLDGIYGCEFLAALKKHLEEDLRID
jgi:2-oxoglutarate dehydrogenase E2 component (dihydrolipoamide succinyltransferase)